MVMITKETKHKCTPEVYRILSKFDRVNLFLVRQITLAGTPSHIYDSELLDYIYFSFDTGHFYVQNA